MRKLLTFLIALGAIVFAVVATAVGEYDADRSWQRAWWRRRHAFWNNEY